MTKYKIPTANKMVKTGNAVGKALGVRVKRCAKIQTA